MKRMFLAVILVFIAASASLTELFYVNSRADSFISSISQIDKAVEEKDLSKALTLCKTTEEKWYDNAAYIDILLIHDYVDNIGISISKMRSYLSSSNTEMYFAESTGAKKALASVSGSEYPNFENIL